MIKLHNATQKKIKEDINGKTYHAYRLEDAIQ